MPDSRETEIEKVARELILMARNTLIVNLRFMDASISKLRPVELEKLSLISTDGKNIGYNPAAIISMFTDEEEQREVAEIFNTKLEELTTPQEKEKAFHDILYQVKKNSYEYYTAQLGSDVNALQKVIAGKKALEELGKTHISLD